VKLGEVQRAIKIADAYGKRLCDDKNIVSRLIAGYPSHGFVIDFEEARTIFPSVRFVNQDEAKLERLLFHLVRNENDEPTISDLVEFTKQQENNSEEVEKNITLTTEETKVETTNNDNSNGITKATKNKTAAI